MIGPRILYGHKFHSEELGIINYDFTGDILWEYLLVVERILAPSEDIPFVLIGRSQHGQKRGKFLCLFSLSFH